MSDERDEWTVALIAYANDTLEPAERGRVAAALEGSPGLRQELDDIMVLRQAAVADDAPDTVPASVWERLDGDASVARPLPPPPPSGGRHRPRSPTPRQDRAHRRRGGRRWRGHRRAVELSARRRRAELPDNEPASTVRDVSCDRHRRLQSAECSGTSGPAQRLAFHGGGRDRHVRRGRQGHRSV